MNRSRLRVLGGGLRGRSLIVPPTARPTEARVREALASIWQQRLDGARVLDLFAGSGAWGIEALSRGAGLAVFVEDEVRALAALGLNSSLLAPGSFVIERLPLPRGVQELARRHPRGFHLVFADPPYDFSDYAGLLEGAARLLAGDGELAVEHSKRVALPEAIDTLQLTVHRLYGETVLSFYRRIA